MLVFGTTEFAARLPSALAAVGGALVVYRIGDETFSWHLGVMAACLFLIYPPVLLGDHNAQTGDTDMLFTLFGTLFVWWLWRGRDEQRYLIPSAVAAGAAILTKGFAAGIFLLVAIPLVAADWRSYLSRRLIQAITIGLAVILPWPVYAYLHYPDEFVWQMVILNVIKRAAGEYGGSSGAIFGFMNYPYFQKLPSYVGPGQWWPFAALLGFGIAYCLGRIVRHRETRRRDVFFVWWAVAIPVGWAVLGGTYIHYLLPLAVPATVVTAVAIEPIVRRVREWSRSSLADSAVDGAYLVCGLVVVVLIWSVYPLPASVTARDVGQKQVGEAFDGAPPEAGVCVQSDIEEWTYPMWFYIDHDMESVSVERIDGDQSIRYAVVSERSRSRIDRPYTILADPDGTELVAIRLTGETGEDDQLRQGSGRLPAATGSGSEVATQRSRDTEHERASCTHGRSMVP
jgi:hypothetical protein